LFAPNISVSDIRSITDSSGILLLSLINEKKQGSWSKSTVLSKSERLYKRETAWLTFREKRQSSEVQNVRFECTPRKIGKFVEKNP